MLGILNNSVREKLQRWYLGEDDWETCASKIGQMLAILAIGGTTHVLVILANYVRRIGYSLAILTKDDTLYH